MAVKVKSLDELNKKLAKISEELAKSMQKMPDSILRDLSIGANKIRNTIILGMRGTQKASWFYLRGIGRKTKRRGKGLLSTARKHYPSAPGEMPAIDSGELISRIIWSASKNPLEVEVGVEGGAPYAKYLEGGTEMDWDSVTFGTIKKSKMKPRPFLGPAVEKHRQKILDDIGDDAFEILGDIFK